MNDFIYLMWVLTNQIEPKDNAYKHERLQRLSATWVIQSGALIGCVRLNDVSIISSLFIKYEMICSLLLYCLNIRFFHFNLLPYVPI